MPAVKMPAAVSKPETRPQVHAQVHCFLCSHNVPATVLVDRRSTTVKSGQKCPRCGSSLDAAFIMRIERAA